MPLPNTLSTKSAGNQLPASHMNAIKENEEYLDEKINSQIQINGASFHPSATNGASYASFETSTNKNNFRVMDFEDSGYALFAEFLLELPADYDGGPVTAHFNWTCANASTNSVVWGIQGVAYADSDALDAAFGSAQLATDANNANGDLNKSDETSAITIAGTPAAGKTVLLRVYRDSAHASDNLAATARLLDVVITYTRT
jgi:hypothetical protein